MCIGIYIHHSRAYIYSHTLTGGASRVGDDLTDPTKLEPPCYILPAHARHLSTPTPPEDSPASPASPPTAQQLDKEPEAQLDVGPPLVPFYPPNLDKQFKVRGREGEGEREGGGRRKGGYVIVPLLVLVRIVIQYSLSGPVPRVHQISGLLSVESSYKQEENERCVYNHLCPSLLSTFCL